MASQLCPLRCRWRDDFSRIAISSKPRNLLRTYSSVAGPQFSHSERTIFSGIQPTGIPHLGNYLGALRQWVRLQNASANESKLIFSIVDLHALTVPQEPSRLRQWRRKALAMLLAVGLDPKQSTIFYQSAVCDFIFLRIHN
jgi:tryptophanyl-tRNA synthetase